MMSLGHFLSNKKTNSQVSNENNNDRKLELMSVVTIILVTAVDMCS